MKSPCPLQRRKPPNFTASYPRRPGSSVALWFTTTSGRPILTTRPSANLVVTEIPSHDRSALHQFTYCISVLRWRHVMTPQKLSLAVQVFGYNNSKCSLTFRAISSRSRSGFDKLKIARLIRKFSAFSRAQRFIAVFTRARPWPPYWTKLIHSNLSHCAYAKFLVISSIYVWAP